MSFVTFNFWEFYSNKADLRWEDNEGDADHDDHVELRRPDVRHKVAVADRGKGDDDVVHGLEQVEVAVSGPLKVLHPAHAAK